MDMYRNASVGSLFIKFLWLFCELHLSVMTLLNVRERDIWARWCGYGIMNFILQHVPCTTCERLSNLCQRTGVYNTHPPRPCDPSCTIDTSSYDQGESHCKPLNRYVTRCVALDQIQPPILAPNLQVAKPNTTAWLPDPALCVSRRLSTTLTGWALPRTAPWTELRTASSKQRLRRICSASRAEGSR